MTETIGLKRKASQDDLKSLADGESNKSIKTVESINIDLHSSEDTRNKGMLRVKPEYRLLSSSKDTQNSNYDDDGAEAAGVAHTSGSSKHKNRGQNKPKDRKQIVQHDSIRLCNKFATGEQCNLGSNCKYSHDIQAYLAEKEPDLGPVCPQFALLDCTRSKEFIQWWSAEEIKLQQRLNELKKRKEEPRVDQDGVAEPVAEPVDVPVTDNQINIESTPATQTNSTTHKEKLERIEAGAEATLIPLRPNEKRLIFVANLGIQRSNTVYTNRRDTVAKVDCDFIDLNMGCPIDTMTKSGNGSALLERKNKVRGMLLGAVHVSSVPITIKMRIGLSNKKIGHKIIPLARDCGLRLLRFMDGVKNSDHSTDSELPLAGIMVGRGALSKPWIFKEIKERKLWDISSGILEVLPQRVNERPEQFVEGMILKR
ncbi:hypothetical protein BSLG_005709 [Batrachochytrium salamandrivorans]|nr:hypothetical protein BSLG_005709 [Batrachochytrium salamandrivorans]